MWGKKNCVKLRVFILSIFLSALSNLSNAQYRLDYGIQAGASNYLGELGGQSQTRRDFVSDMKLGETRWDPSIFVRYKFNPKLAAKIQFSYLRIQGADSLSSNPAREARNLSFRNDIFELSAAPQLTIYENQDLGSSYKFKMSFNFYVSAGVGVFHHNPQANYYGEWINLQPLKTEGEVKPYNLWQFAVPIATGFYFTIRKKHRFGFEYNWRICFTDYLDDVSTLYGNPKNMSKIGAELSNRTDELSTADKTKILTDVGPGTTANWFNNFGYGTSKDRHGNIEYNKRGDSKHNDTYMTATFNYSYVIRGHGKFYKSRYGSFFGKKRRKNTRKVRAKF